MSRTKQPDFAQWRTIYEPLYGALADRELYRLHAQLEPAPDPETYCDLVPAAARKVLGEFYTPDWLVARVLDRAGFRGGRMLDPACGAGAFLAEAGAGATGWDINPIAVRMAAARCPEARVEIRDAFFTERETYELIAGNPPWVNWRRLPLPYRNRIEPLWREYGLFSHAGLKARLGGAMDDISALMTYACADRYLAFGGRLAFLLPAALFQSAGGGAGFRRFELPGGAFLRVVLIEEVAGMTSFDGATTRPAIAVFEKSRTATVYPVRYLRGDAELEARPISEDPTAPWSVLPKGSDTCFDRLRGESPYVARVGAHTGGAAGVYWLDVIEDRGAALLVRNRAKAGKNPYDEITAEVESALVHPLVRGRDLRDGRAPASGHVIVPHDSSGKPLSIERMRSDYPLAFAYFETFREPMLARAHYRQHFQKAGQPYWSMYNVGPYTFAPYRVAWREQSNTFESAVLENGCVADAKLVTVAVDSPDEARYLADFLNSPEVRRFVESYAVKTQISTHVMRYLKVPPFARST